MRRLWYYYLYLLIVWGSFRWFIRLPEAIEELWFKPLIWLIPLFWWNLSLPSQLIMFGKNWWQSISLGTVVGLIYFVLLRRFNLGTVSWGWNLLGVVSVTAVTEELVFSGFVAGYIERIQKRKWINFLIVAMMVAIIRLPILLFVNDVGWKDLLGVLLIAGATGAINAWIRVTTGNVTGSILARIGMNLAVLG